MLKLALLTLFLATGAAMAQLIPLGGCDPGYDFVLNGNYYCWYAPVGQQSNPDYQFVCEGEGECVSHCYPYECCVKAPGAVNDPQADRDRKRVLLPNRK